jgi:hypothetical protein
MLFSENMHNHTFIIYCMIYGLSAWYFSLHPYVIYMLLIPPFRFFYYTAGSGGAGPTVLATSFLLLGEDVIAYNKGTYDFFTNAPTVQKRS